MFHEPLLMVKNDYKTRIVLFAYAFRFSLNHHKCKLQFIDGIKLKFFFFDELCSNKYRK